MAKEIGWCHLFFLRLKGGIIGVTASHVIEAYQSAVAANAHIVCQLRQSPVFDLSSAVIQKDSFRDIATFKVSEEILTQIGAIALDSRVGWPPPEPQRKCRLSLCGFPESLRTARPDHSAEFGAWGALAVVEDVTREGILITYDPAIVKPAGWADALPPLGFNMSGCSGGPVIMHTNRNGLYRFFPIGLIQAGPWKDRKQGEAAEFDMIRVRRIDVIQPDGLIGRADDHCGWLPGR